MAIERRWLIGLATLALAIRLLPATVNFVVGTDEAAYLGLAQNLAAGRGFTLDGVRPHTEFDPGYPLAASLVYRLGGGLELPAQMNYILGGLFVVPVYLLTRDLYGPATARRAALLCALLPALALGVPNFGASSEQTYILGMWLGLLALWYGLEESRPRAWLYLTLAGLAFGWAHITRWEGAIFLFVGAGWAGWQVIRGQNKRRALLGLIAFVAAFMIVAVPYGVYLQKTQGTWFSSKGTTQQFQGEAQAATDPLAWEREYALYEQARDKPWSLSDWSARLRDNWQAELRLYLINWVRQIALAFRSMTYLALTWTPLVILAWLNRWRVIGPGRKFFFLLTALTPLALFPVASVDPRYLLPTMPVLLIWAAEGLIIADGWIKSRWGDHSSRPLAAVTLTVTLCALWIAADLAGPLLLPTPGEYKHLGEWMRANGIAQGEAILARKRQVPFYAGARWEWLTLIEDPAGDRAVAAATLIYAKERGATYAVIDARTIPTVRPQLAFLLDPAQAPPGWHAVHVEEKPLRIILYRLDD